MRKGAKDPQHQRVKKKKRDMLMYSPMNIGTPAACGPCREELLAALGTGRAHPHAARLVRRKLSQKTVCLPYFSAGYHAFIQFRAAAADGVTKKRAGRSSSVSLLRIPRCAVGGPQDQKQVLDAAPQPEMSLETESARTDPPQTRIRNCWVRGRSQRGWARVVLRPMQAFSVLGSCASTNARHAKRRKRLHL